MPTRQPKQTAKRTGKQAVTTKGRKVGPTASKSTRVAAPGGRRGGRKAPTVKASWKAVSPATRSLVLNSFDAGTRLVTHKVPDKLYTDVHDALISARNQVAVAMETLQVPPSKHDYSHLSTTLGNLKDTKQQLQQRHASLSDMLTNKERELQKLEEEKIYLQDFGKTPGKHHPLLLEPLQKELHLNFDTLK